ncbi:MAG: type VI secretion system tip protein TssI/VgrG [Polyangiaceae bacterium]
MDPFILTTSALTSGARVLGWSGEEGLSRLYELELLVEVPGDAAVDLSDVLNARAALEVRVEPTSAPFQFQGLLSQVELVAASAERTVLRLVLTPALRTLTLSMHSRVFVEKSVPEVIALVLEGAGIDASEYELRLRNTYPVEAHICQYRESDFAFLSRWLEREGMYFFFEHDDRAEKLVICDDLSAHVALDQAPVRYVPSAGDGSAAGALRRATLRRAMRAAAVVVNDYDYDKPMLALTGKAPVWDQGSVSEVHHADRFFDAATGSKLARVLSEAKSAAAVALSAEGPRTHLRSGYTFELVEHPRAELNTRYLARGVRHFARQSNGSSEVDRLLPAVAKQLEIYRAELDAQPANIPFRSLRATPWPRVYGFENGTVDGPMKSDYAQIDASGRYAIKLHFDENQSQPGGGSTWVRMAQPHGGSVEGFHFPLRKGTEVLIEFLDGDPDRPAIVAVLPNATQKSPVSADNHTKNVLQTGGSTRMQIEDAEGGQYMHMTTPVQSPSFYMGHDGTAPGGHNAELSTNGSGAWSYGTYFDRFVGGYKTDKVVGPLQRAYASTYSTRVTGDVQNTYQSNQRVDVTVNVVRTIHGSMTETVDGAVNVHDKSTWTLAVDGDVTETFKAKEDLRVTGTQTVHVVGNGVHTHEAGLGATVNGALSLHTATASYKLEVVPDATMHAAANFSIRGDATAQLAAPATTIGGDQTVDIQGGSTVTFKSKSITATGNSSIKLSGPKIDILGGDIQISGMKIDVIASGALTIGADGNLIQKGSIAELKGGPLVDVHAGVIQLNLTPAPAASGLGPEYDELLKNDPILAARIRLLLAAGYTIQFGGPPGINPDTRVIVLDRGIQQNPQAVLAQIKALTDAPPDQHTLLGMRVDLIASLSANQNANPNGLPVAPHLNACGAYAGTLLYSMYAGTHGMGAGDVSSNLGTVMPTIANNDFGQWAITHGLPLAAGTEMGTNGPWLPGSIEGGLDTMGVPATSGNGLTADQIRANVDNNVATSIAYDPNSSYQNPSVTDGHWGTVAGYDANNVYVIDNTYSGSGSGVQAIPWSELEDRQSLHPVASVLIPDGSYVSVPLVP